MRKLLEAARALVEQCEKCHFVDLLGDKLEMNQGYYDFRAAIAEEEAKMTEPTAKAADTSSRGEASPVVCLCPRDSTQPAPAAEETRLADRKVIELAIQCRQGRGNLNDLAKACDVLLTLRTQAGKKTP